MAAGTNGDLAPLARRTGDVYERQAARFDADRAKGLHERVWLDRFLALLPAAGRVLDVGCGTGDPIARYMAGRGFRVTGVDRTAAMLDLARARFQDGDWRRADMRALDLGETFDGLIAWNSFFHLTPDEQRRTLPRLAAHVGAGGAMMATVGPAAGEVVGTVGGEPVYHASLSLAEYRGWLEVLGFEIVAFRADDPHCAGQTVVLARREP